MLPLVGIAASIDWLHREVMISRAQQHSSACNSRARQTLGQALEPDEMHGQHHLLCINVAAGTAPDIVRSLAERRISIRPLGADRVRLSFGAWNTLDEVDECADLIASYVRPTSS
jgi:selenocysteine lyase/cysteine desulfurase